MMTGTPAQGDLLIRQSSNHNCDVFDVTTRDRLASTATLNAAISIAAKHAGAIWRELLDDEGQPIGLPKLLLPRVR